MSLSSLVRKPSTVETGSFPKFGVLGMEVWVSQIPFNIGRDEKRFLTKLLIIV